MEVNLLLTVFMLLVHVSLAQWQRVTVRKGQTLYLSCPIRNAHRTTVEWRNPKGNIMFFNRRKALKDKRYRIDHLSASEFNVSVSNVTFRDGGNYTCSHYDSPTKETEVEVTVLGSPTMKVTEHEGNHVVKCTAEGNHYPPQISWVVDQGPEILGQAQVRHEDTKYVSVDWLHVQTGERRVTVKCLVRHPAHVSSPLMDFVKIGRKAPKVNRSTTALPTTRPSEVTTAATTTTTAEVGYEAATSTEVKRPPSESSTWSSAVSSTDPRTVTASTGFSTNPAPSTGTQLSNTGWTETTEEILSNNSTGTNTTGDDHEPQLRSEGERRSSLLIFLVTCLIVCLLVVVLFFAVKLRRAHIKWKLENDESDPSEDSNKSKSSQEEKNCKGQRQRGLCNTAFTPYAIEKTTVMVASDLGAVTESVNTLQTFPPRPLAQGGIKETEL